MSYSERPAMVSIVAIDPGKSTGIATIDANLDSWWPVGDWPLQVSVGYFKHWLPRYINDHNGPTVFIIEDFIKRPDHKSGKWDPLLEKEQIGWTQGFLDAHDLRWVKQQPSDRSAVQKSSIFPKFSYKDRHYADALAHAITFYRTWSRVERYKRNG